jgi:hypothetical protein
LYNYPENLNKAVKIMADKLIPEMEARQMAKALLDEFGITAGLKKQYAKQPDEAEELIDRYGRFYWMVREMLSKPPQQRRGGFRGSGRREED